MPFWTVELGTKDTDLESLKYTMSMSTWLAMNYWMILAMNFSIKSNWL